MSEEILRIKESGLLELYALGELDLHDKAIVEAALAEHPSLREELHEIERAFMSYAFLQGKDAPPELRDKILENLPAQQPPVAEGSPTTTSPAHRSSGINPFLAGLLLVALGALSLYLWNSQQEYQRELEASRLAYTTLEEECDRRNTQYALALGGNSTILPFAATPNYQETRLYLSTNETSQTNYLNVQRLPAIAAGETFQLWSLGTQEDPIPLQTFDDSTDLLEFDYVAGSQAYAITIEAAGGSTAPNLDRLIGVVEVPSQG